MFAGLHPGLPQATQLGIIPQLSVVNNRLDLGSTRAPQVMCNPGGASITSLGSARPGTVRTVIFIATSGSLSNNGAAITLRGLSAAYYNIQSGDQFDFVSTSPGQWMMLRAQLVRGNNFSTQFYAEGGSPPFAAPSAAYATVAIGDAAFAGLGSVMALGPNTYVNQQGQVQLGACGGVQGYSTATFPNSLTFTGSDSVAPWYSDGATNHKANGSTVLMMGRTTDGSTVEMFCTGSGSTRLVLPDPGGTGTGLYFFHGFIHAKTMGNSPASVATWEVRAAIRRPGGGSVSMIQAANVAAVSYGTSGTALTAPTITADTTNQSMKVTVTGLAATTLHWFARYNVSEFAG